MANEIPKGLEWSFLLHFFVGAFFGVVLLIFPEGFLTTINWPGSDYVITRFLGGTLIAICSSSLLAWREKEVQKVRLVMEMEMVWLVISVVVLLLACIVTLNWMAWVGFAVFVAFLLDFGFYYFKTF